MYNLNITLNDMAKELVFKLSGADYGAAPVKLERKKIYGWTDIVATDRNNNVYSSAYLSPDDAQGMPFRLVCNCANHTPCSTQRW